MCCSDLIAALPDAEDDRQQQRQQSGAGPAAARVPIVRRREAAAAAAGARPGQERVPGQEVEELERAGVDRGTWASCSTRSFDCLSVCRV